MVLLVSILSYFRATQPMLAPERPSGRHPSERWAALTAALDPPMLRQLHFSTCTAMACLSAVQQQLYQVRYPAMLLRSQLGLWRNKDCLDKISKLHTNMMHSNGNDAAALQWKSHCTSAAATVGL